MLSHLLQRIEEIENQYQKSIMTPANEKNIELVKEWISKNIKKTFG
ncbi:hypothetical protein QKW52_28915 [Bacillus sonorensis]|nr:hypothetical protein [Bacillus sonorensis]MDI3412497.1 hypothetical protein [Bacillus sonorensis]MEC1537575.1 hypothetical protein [Bacillus sonorensis]